MLRLPDAEIYVYDNNSTDRTIETAKSHGAVVRSETRQGKGHVVRRMFSDVEADIFILVDGDATYDAASAPELVAKLLNDGLDMVSASRRQVSDEAYRRGHVLRQQDSNRPRRASVRLAAKGHAVGLSCFLPPFC